MHDRPSFHADRITCDNLQLEPQVDDVLHTALTERFDVVTDKGTLDAIGLSASAAHDRHGIAPWSIKKLSSAC